MPPEPTPIPKMRRGLIKAMNVSAAVPQFTLDRTLDMSAVLAVRARAKEDGTMFSITDVLIAALARALKRHSRVNASYLEDGLLTHDQVNVGLAVALPDVVIAPAIFDTDQRTLVELAAERQRLVTAAKEGKLSMAEVTSATSSLSNLGVYGVDRFRALVTPPQASVVAVGSLRRVAVPRGDRVEIVSAISVSASFDHRVVDGAPGAQFLDHFARDIEEPDWISAALDAPVAAEVSA